MNAQHEWLGSIPAALVAIGLLLVASFGVGALVVSIAATRPSRVSDVLLLRISLGLSLIGTFGVVAGAAKCLGGGASILCLVVLALLGLFRAWRERAVIARQLAASRRRMRLWLMLPALVLVAITLGPALCPPTGWDELVYHHELPRRWLADGWPAFYADLPYSSFPSLGEILFWLVGPIEGVIAPRLLTWACWMIGLALFYRLLRRRLAAVSAMTLLMAVALSETWLLVSANCYVESIVLMDAAAILLVIHGLDIPAGRQAVILGVLGGGAAGVKLTGVAVLVVPVLWSVVQRKQVQWMAVYLLTGIGVALPFYLRPWLLTGDPFYPYYAQWFNADPAGLEMSRYHHALGAAFGLHRLGAFLFAPVLLMFDSTLFDGTFGWQLLPIVALAGLGLVTISRRRARPHVVWPAVAAAWLYSFWCATAQQARFAIPASLAVAVLAALGLRRLHGRERRVALGVLLATTLVSVPWRTAGLYFGSWMCDLGAISRTDYVNELTDREYLPLIDAIGERTRADAKIMLLFEHRGFYVPRTCVIGTPYFQEAVFTPSEPFSDAEQVMEVFDRHQITHVVMTKEAVGPDKPASWFDRLNGFAMMIEQCVATGGLQVVWASDRYFLLEVKPKQSP